MTSDHNEKRIRDLENQVIELYQETVDLAQANAELEMRVARLETVLDAFSSGRGEAEDHMHYILRTH